MTDTTAGRGGVGIRLFVQGGEIVRRTFDQVGDSGKKMWAQIALGEKSANPAIRALSLGVGEAKQGIQGLVSQSGSAGVALGAFGAAGVALAAVLGAVAIATSASFEAMRNAADLTDASERIGITATALQELKFAAEDAGIGADALNGGLERLNGVIGAFKLGIGDAKLKPVFEELGITQDQLANVETSDQLLTLLADTLGQVKDRSEQVKLARALQIEELLPLLRLGSDGIAGLRDEAQQLGVVMDEDVRKRLDEADRQMEISGQQMRILRDTAVAPLASAFADASTYVAGLAVEFSHIEAQGPKWLATLLALGRALPGAGLYQRAYEMVVSRVLPNGGRSTEETATTITADQFLSGVAGTDRNYRPGFSPLGHTSSGGGNTAARAAADAERRAQERTRALDALTRQELEAQRASIQARYGPGGTDEDASALARANVTLEVEAQNAARAALRAQLEKAGALDADAEVRLEELRIAQEELAKAKDAQIIQDHRRDLAAKRLQAETAADRDAIDLLQVQADMVRTAHERYEIQRRILLAEQALERKTLEGAADEDGRRTRAERRRIADQRTRQDAEVQLFDQNHQEQLRQQFNSYGREVVQAIEDGRIGEYIGEKIKERLLDGALNALFNAIGQGGGGKKGGGFLGGLLNFGSSLLSGGKGKIGKASGGDVRDGFVYRMAEHGPELLLMGGQGQVTSAAETAKMVRDMAGSGDGARRAPGDGMIVQMPSITINAPGADAAALARVERRVEQLQRDMPAMAVRAVDDAATRRHRG